MRVVVFLENLEEGRSQKGGRTWKNGAGMCKHVQRRLEGVVRYKTTTSSRNVG